MTYIINLFKDRLLGTWSNQLQAISKPFLFSYVIMEFYINEFGDIIQTQKYKHSKDPYRIRKLKIEQHESENNLKLNLFKDTNLLSSIIINYNLELDNFTGKIRPEDNIEGVWQNTHYLSSMDFILSTNELCIRDQGVDPKTHKHIWGQENEPFLFIKK